MALFARHWGSLPGQDSQWGQNGAINKMVEWQWRGQKKSRVTSTRRGRSAGLLSGSLRTFAGVVADAPGGAPAARVNVVAGVARAAGAVAVAVAAPADVESHAV